MLSNGACRDLSNAGVKQCRVVRRLENNMELTQANVRHLRIHLAQFQVGLVSVTLKSVYYGFFPFFPFSGFMKI